MSGTILKDTVDPIEAVAPTDIVSHLETPIITLLTPESDSGVILEIPSAEPQVESPPDMAGVVGDHALTSTVSAAPSPETEVTLPEPELPHEERLSSAEGAPSPPAHARIASEYEETAADGAVQESEPVDMSQPSESIEPPSAVNIIEPTEVRVSSHTAFGVRFANQDGSLECGRVCRPHAEDLRAGRTHRQ